MKILYNLAGTFNSGGMERIVISKANALNEAGFRVFIVTTEQQGRKPYFKIDDRIECIDLGINYSRDNGRLLHKLLHFPFRQRKHLCMLRKVIEEKDPDIIISTFGNEVRVLPKIKTRAKKVLEIHFSKYFRTQENRRGLWRIIDRLRTRQDQRTVSAYDKFIVLTYEDKALWGDIPNIEVIPNFIDNVSTAPAKLENKKSLAIGRLTYQKGFDRLVSIWPLVHKQCPEWELAIYGNGEQRENLQRQIEKMGLSDSIEIHNPTSEISEVYQNISILLSTSRYEGLPMVLIEGLSHGLPIVSYACKCGPRDIIEDAVNGFIVEEGDADAFATRVIELINNYELRKQIGYNAWMSSQKYTKDVVMLQWTKLFTELYRIK